MASWGSGRGGGGLTFGGCMGEEQEDGGGYMAEAAAVQVLQAVQQAARSQAPLSTSLLEGIAITPRSVLVERCVLPMGMGTVCYVCCACWVLQVPHRSACCREGLSL